MNALQCHAAPPSLPSRQVILLDFLATTCGPCRPALTALQSLYARCPHLRVVGIALDDADTAALVRPLLHQIGVTFPVRVAPAANQKLAQAFGVQTYPALFLLNGQGRVVWSHSGPLDARAQRALAAQVARLLPPK